jgi:hypothetical protein
MERPCEPGKRLGISLRREPVERGTEIAVFGRETFQERRLTRQVNEGRQRRCELQVPPCVPLADRFLLLAGGQLLQSELASRLQHAVARLAAEAVVLPQQARINQRGNTVQWVTDAVARDGHHGLRSLQREATHEHRQPSEHDLIVH